MPPLRRSTGQDEAQDQRGCAKSCGKCSEAAVAGAAVSRSPELARSMPCRSCRSGGQKEPPGHRGGREAVGFDPAANAPAPPPVRKNVGSALGY